jgi:hypothetical protein
MIVPYSYHRRWMHVETKCNPRGMLMAKWSKTARWDLHWTALVVNLCHENELTLSLTARMLNGSLVQRSPTVCLYVCDQETPKWEAKGPSWTMSACECMNAEWLMKNGSGGKATQTTTFSCAYLNVTPRTSGTCHRYFTLSYRSFETLWLVPQTIFLGATS